MDELGDFDSALNMAAEMGRTGRRPVWVRPRRGIVERLTGRMGGPGAGEGLVAELERLMAGGLYYVAAPPFAGPRAVPGMRAKV